MPRPGQLRFDAERARALVRIYLTPDVVEQRRVTLEALALRPGERVLDLGCGPGLLADEMAVALGPRGAVHGVDVSPDMLAIAAARALSPGAAPITLAEGDAGRLDLPDGGHDALVCTQVYEYVADMPEALREAHRVIAPGGRIAILDTDWDSIVWRSSDDARMARVLHAWDEHLAHRDLPRYLPELLAGAGFTGVEVRVVPILNVGTESPTYSEGMRELIADFVPGRRGVNAEEARAWLNDLAAMGDRYFFSVNRYLVTASRPAAR